MTYNKTNWVDNTNPAINANNLNKIENELEILDDQLNSLEEDYIEEFQKLKVYSTSETIVGIWIDNKPIYRKVLIPYQTQSYAPSTSYTISVDPDIDKIIRWDVLVTGNTNNNQEINKYVIPGRYTKSSNSITIESTATYSTNITHIILEYTKVSS